MYFSPLIPVNKNKNIDNDILEKAQDICIKSAKLSSLYNEHVISSLQNFLQITNIYYSNKLENQEIDVEHIYEAKHGRYSTNSQIKSLQNLSFYNITMQDYLSNNISSFKNPYSKDILIDIHKKFYSQPGMDKFLKASFEGQNLSMQPGSTREINVIRRNQESPSFGILSMLLEQFGDTFYTSLQKDKARRLIYAICSYHRLTWIHPFLFGNERIARIHLDFLFEFLKIDGCKLWNISRALEKHFIGYVKALYDADLKLQSKSDGFGPLSNSGLRNYLVFMLNAIGDEIDFIHKNLIQMPLRIQNYIKLSQNGFFDAEPLPKQSDVLFEKLLLFGEFPRGEVKNIIKKQNRSATYFTKKLTKLDFVYSDTPRGNLKLKFNPHFASKLFPELLPE